MATPKKKVAEAPVETVEENTQANPVEVDVEVEEGSENADNSTDPDLIILATEMNEVMGLEPPINCDLPQAELLAKIKVESLQILIEDKKTMSEETWTFLTENGLIDHLAPPKKAEKPGKPAKSEKPAKHVKEKVEKVAKEKTARPGREGIEKDEFGFYVDQPRHQFGKMLKAAGDEGITMGEAKKADWNTTGASFNDPWRIITELGLGEKINGRMVYTGKK